MVPRKKISDGALTPLELEIMSVLWDTGPANVQTVQALLNVLHRKGRVKRQLKERAYLYQPLLSRQKAVTQAVGDMLDRFFGGSADSLVLNLVETRHLTPEKLAQIQKLLERPEEEEHGNH